MGWGDELMAAGQAQAESRRRCGRIAIRDRYGRVRSHAIFERVAGVARPGESFVGGIINGPGARPYIAAKSTEKWYWAAHRPTPPVLTYTAEEIAFAERHAGRVILGASLKDAASPNKEWPSHHWRELVRLLEGLPIAQIGPPGMVGLDGVPVIECPDFLHACALMARARAYVGHEGGLHHAAAAGNVPAVVIMGGYIGPSQTGYALPHHRYLTAGGDPCGARLPCDHCKRAMAEISPELVRSTLSEVLK
jgi:hypothetical protein